MQQTAGGNIVAVSNLTGFFRDEFRNVTSTQHVEVDDHTEHYVVNLLAGFARSERLEHPTVKDRGPIALAQLLAAAFEADTAAERDLERIHAEAGRAVAERRRDRHRDWHAG